MEPEADPIDLAELDPTRDGARFDATVARVARRAIELRKLRRALVRRGAVAFAVAMAAALVLWFSAPHRESAPPPRSPDLLEWATRDVQPAEVLELGGGYAQ
jgi:hypothetical protein